MKSFLIAILFLPMIVLAHPGRTAGDGCHYCRTNCAKWGEVHGARHCHGGGSISKPTYNPPAVKLAPTVRNEKPSVVIPVESKIQNNKKIEDSEDNSFIIGAIVVSALLIGGAIKIGNKNK